MQPHCLSWDPFLAVVFSVVFAFFLQYSLKQYFSTDSVLIPIGWHAAANELLRADQLCSTYMGNIFVI